MKFAAEKGFVQQLALLNHDITQYLNKLFTAPNINANNYFYLLKLLNHPGVTQSDFSTLVKLNQSTVTRAINTLTAHGYITKTPSTDKRSQFLFLTELGEKTAQEIKVVIDEINAQFVGPIGDKKVDQLFAKSNATLQALEKK